MQNDFYENISYCSLCFVGEKENLDLFSDKFELNDYIKIDVNQHCCDSQKQDKIYYCINSPKEISSDDTIQSHIEFFKSIFKGKENEISSFQSNKNIDSIFNIFVETEAGGFGLDLSYEESLFIKSISNSFKLRVLNLSSINESKLFNEII